MQPTKKVWNFVLRPFFEDLAKSESALFLGAPDFLFFPRPRRGFLSNRIAPSIFVKASRLRTVPSSAKIHSTTTPGSTSGANALRARFTASHKMLRDRNRRSLNHRETVPLSRPPL